MFTAYAACSSPDVVDLTGDPDGTYALEVYLVDQAGNTGSPASSDYVLDRLAPGVPTINSGPPATDNDTTPTWAFTGEAGATFTCQVDGPSGPGSFAACTSPTTPTLSQGDGNYTFMVRATDAAGNTSGAASGGYQLDTTAPAVPSLSAPASPSQSTSPSFTFTAEAGATTQCRLDGPAGVGSFGACTSPYVPSLTDGDGTYIVRVRATDQAGNTGATASASYVLDTTAPAAPVVSGPTGPSAVTSVSWTFTPEAGATTECRLVGPTSTTAWSACTSPTTLTLAQGDGTYTLEVRATDLAGNLGSAGASPGYDLLTTAPPAPVVTAPPSPSSDNTPVFTFTTAAKTTTQCQLTGPASTGPWANCTSPRSVSANQGDGTYILAVQAKDKAGNLSAVGSASYLLDTQAPAAPAVSGPTSPGNSAAVSFTFATEAGASAECQLAGPGGTSPWVACASPASITLGGGDGSYTFRVRATDAAGNTGPAGSASYTLDTQAPNTPTVSGPASPDNDTSPAFTFTAAGATTIECRLDGPAGTGPWAACASPLTVPLADGDGVYTFLVHATDAAGNTSTAGSVSYALDTASPAAPVISGPTGPSNVSPVTWTFTAEAGATTQCRLFLAGSPVGTWNNCASPATVNLNAGDGNYTLQVRATDPAGNTGSAGSSPAYLLDTQAPVTPSLSGPASPGNATTVAFTFSAEPGSTTACRLDGPGGPGVFAPCTSPAAYALSQGDGTYVFRVRATDAAGNAGPIASVGYVLDTAPPATPTITANPTSPGKSRTPSWSFTLPADGTGLCQVSRGLTVIAPWVACTSPYVADLSGQPDGTYTFAVESVDLAGNLSAAATSSYLLDTTAPAAAVVSPPSGTTGNDATPSWTFTVEAGATTQCEVLRGATVIVASAACSSPVSADLSASGDGSYTLLVWATDAADNTGAPATVSYVLDTAPPAAPVITGTPAATSASRAPSWTFTAEAGATTQCRLTLDGAQPGTFSACTSPYVGNLTGAPDGTYDFEVLAVDAAGNTGPSATSGFTLDTTAPAAPTLVSSPGSPSKVLNPAWGFSAETGATTACEVTGPLGVVAGWSSCTSPYSADLSGQPDGALHLPGAGHRRGRQHRAVVERRLRARQHRSRCADNLHRAQRAGLRPDADVDVRRRAGRDLHLSGYPRCDHRGCDSVVRVAVHRRPHRPVGRDLHADRRGDRHVRKHERRVDRAVHPRHDRPRRTAIHSHANEPGPAAQSVVVLGAGDRHDVELPADPRQRACSSTGGRAPRRSSGTWSGTPMGRTPLPFA